MEKDEYTNQHTDIILLSFYQELTVNMCSYFHITMPLSHEEQLIPRRFIQTTVRKNLTHWSKLENLTPIHHHPTRSRIHQRAHQHIQRCKLSSHPHHSSHKQVAFPTAKRAPRDSCGLGCIPEADPGGRRDGEPVGGGRGAAPAFPSPAPAASTGAATPRRGGRRLAEEIGDPLHDVHRPRSKAASSSSASPPRARGEDDGARARRARGIRFESNTTQPDRQVVAEVERGRSREGNRKMFWFLACELFY